MPLVALLAATLLVLSLIWAQRGETGWAIFNLCAVLFLIIILAVKHYG